MLEVLNAFLNRYRFIYNDHTIMFFYGYENIKNNDSFAKLKKNAELCNLNQDRWVEIDENPIHSK